MRMLNKKNTYQWPWQAWRTNQSCVTRGHVIQHLSAVILLLSVLRHRHLHWLSYLHVSFLEHFHAFPQTQLHWPDWMCFDSYLFSSVDSVSRQKIFHFEFLSQSAIFWVASCWAKEVIQKYLQNRWNLINNKLSWIESQDWRKNINHWFFLSALRPPVARHLNTWESSPKWPPRFRYSGRAHSPSPQF